MKRLQDIHNQLITNTGSVKPIVVIRFNPDTPNDIDEELKFALKEVFSGVVKLGDARGIIVHALIGYGKTRKRQYNTDPITKRIKI